ncbi:MAG: sulfite exporter TauE/SafE family protein [Deltaproteobacteria bacterium]|nr:sulfite exporter TauE/SafE family protein [Deltaproteobacteria bacterium]
MTIELLAPFLIGLLGSLHCLGMCGPLVMAYSLNIKKPETQTERLKSAFWDQGFFHHLEFHLGRIIAYGILGALVAGLFTIVGVSLYWDIRGALLLSGGALITLLGLVLLRVFPLPSFLTRYSLPPPSLWNRFLPSLLQTPGSISKTALGAACGLLPCPLTTSMLVKAAITENVAEGAMTMLAFGLGTVPALLTLGISASLLTLRIRIIGERVAALSVIAMGLFLIFKGAKLLLGFLLGHCH